MSFEKEGKSSGTRRKARECALQMLFAVDLVGPERFSAARYWSELGYDEVFRGAGQLAVSFLEHILRFEKLAADLKAWLKRAEPYEKTNSRIDRVKGLLKGSEAFRSEYQGFIADVVSNLDVTTDGLSEQLNTLRFTFDRLINDIEVSVLGRRNYLSAEDRSQFAELREQGGNLFTKAAGEFIPQLARMATSVRPTRAFADKLFSGATANLAAIDERIKTRAEHWRIERMAIVDRNVLRLAVYEFLHEDTPHTVVINEALEIARRFSSFEATQFINGILDAIKLDLEKPDAAPAGDELSQASST